MFGIGRKKPKQKEKPKMKVRSRSETTWYEIGEDTTMKIIESDWTDDTPVSRVFLDVYLDIEAGSGKEFAKEIAAIFEKYALAK